MNNLVKNNNNLVSLFDELFNGVTPAQNREFVNVPVNIHEDKEQYEIEVVAPGLKKDEFHIGLENNLLTISYEKKEENKEVNKERKTYKLEYRSASFKRTFTLEDNINKEAINASYEDGILKIQLPKQIEEKVAPKEITIK